MSKTIYRSIAAAAVLTLSVSGTAGIALAETTPGNINADTPVSLTIHKYETGGITPAAGKADGSVQINGTGIDGVVFKAHRLDLDLTKPADWAKLYTNGVNGGTAKVPADTVCNDTGELTNTDADIITSVRRAADTDDVKATVEGTTAGGGTLVLNEKMKVGAYLICEGDTSNAKKGAEKVVVRSKAKPFIVTLPLPTKGEANAATATDVVWNYTPHVYPKNELTSLPTKNMTVDDLAVTGKTDAITIELGIRIPSLAAGKHFNYFMLEDVMVKELKPSEQDANYTFTVTPDGQTYAYGTDFTVTRNYQAGQPTSVKLELTEAGLTKLDNDVTKTATLTFKATMTDYPKGYGQDNANGVFFNKAKSQIKTGDNNTPTPPTPQDPPPTESDEEVASTWGKIKAVKLDAKNTDKHLQGAKFEVYAFPLDAGDPEQICANATQATLTEKKAKPVQKATGGNLELISNENGVIELDSIHIDTKKATLPTKPTPATKLCVYLKEIEAPAGYTLPADDKVFTPFVVDSTVETIQNPTNIENTPHSVPDLPLTGANGQLLMSIIGGALMLGSFGAYLVVRRRRAEQA